MHYAGEREAKIIRWIHEDEKILEINKKFALIIVITLFIY
jgi:hypothetical protein